jgi:hypothetical protein
VSFEVQPLLPIKLKLSIKETKLKINVRLTTHTSRLVNGLLAPPQV